MSRLFWGVPPNGANSASGASASETEERERWRRMESTNNPNDSRALLGGAGTSAEHMPRCRVPSGGLSWE
eukprot:scaffold261371_cov33-Tisochrysis_lutea.AAC.1